tara:strand:+ start:115 stop:1149 length:1035 start_codon:yes stop_codon:yes gene_type:complete
MNINFDGIIYSLQKYGGISNYFTNLINESSQILPKKTQLSLYGNPRIEYNITSKVKNYKYRTLERYRDVLNISDGSILHSSYYRISKSKKVKNVITLYDFTYEKFNYNVRSAPHIYQKNKAIRNADAIICISNNTKNDLLNYYPSLLNENKVFVTHLSASDDFTSLKTPYNKRIINPFVIFVGPRVGYKNFKIVVKALEIKKDISLCIVGGGNLTSEEILELNQKLGKRYRHLGYVSSAELNQLYNKALCLVYPSLYEGFGIPILEAQKAACPVICNNISSIPEVAGNGAIILNNCTAESVSHSIDMLLNEKNFLSLIKKGHQNSLRFSWSKTANKTKAIFKEL